MQPLRQLIQALDALADADHALFTPVDLRAAVPDLAPGAFRTLISRASRNGTLERVCRGLYLYPRARYAQGLLLYHAAARLRAHAFNYISLESALSDVGVISQIPMARVTLMSSARTATIDCGRYGSIEFVHTEKRPGDLIADLTYDHRCHLWRASTALALRDMRATGRDTGLIDWELADEPVQSPGR